MNSIKKAFASFFVCGLTSFIVAIVLLVTFPKLVIKQYTNGDGTIEPPFYENNYTKKTVKNPSKYHLFFSNNDVFLKVVLTIGVAVSFITLLMLLST